MIKNILYKIQNISTFDYFLLLVIINVILMALAMHYYPERFYFWSYPFSYLGATKSFNPVAVSYGSAPNSLSSLIYSLDMFLSGLVILALSYKYYRKSSGQKSILKTMLSFLCGTGFIIACFSPDDTRHNFHVLGSTLVVVALWILATNYLFEIKENISKIKYILLQLTLQIPIFSYGGFYFANFDPYSEILQKFALLGIGFVLLFGAKHVRDDRD